MSEKDLDEQFADIVAHWHEDALGVDPVGDEPADGTKESARDDRTRDTAAPGEAGPGEPAPGEAARPRATPGKDPPGDAAPDRSELDRTAPGLDNVPPLSPAPTWRLHDPPEVEDHFEPPPPQPLPSGEDTHFWGIIIGLVGGPLLLLTLALFDRDGSGWWKLFALGLTIAGFVLLVLREPQKRDEDDDGVRL